MTRASFGPRGLSIRIRKIRPLLNNPECGVITTSMTLAWLRMGGLAAALFVVSGNQLPAALWSCLSSLAVSLLTLACPISPCIVIIIIIFLPVNSLALSELNMEGTGMILRYQSK